VTVTPIYPNSTGVLLCFGLFEYLAGLGLVTWRETQNYVDVPGQACGFLGTVPEAPDRILTLTPYGLRDDAAEPMSLAGVQVRTRWAGTNPRGVLNFSGAIFGALHGLGPVTLPGDVSISQCLRTSSGSLGQEPSGAKRWSHADNYYVDLDSPSTHRVGG
jgi:hypothetical protein